jgi:ferredoxin/flavodoxin---NADP+ reductase
MSVTDDKFYRPRITQRVDFAPDLWMIRINPGGEFKFVPGQYATLGVEGPQKRSERPYSIVSSPYENEIEFFFELVHDGDLTPQLYRLQRGDELLMRKVAKGRFTLDTRSGRTNHLLVCTVTGIAPFVSYVRTLYQDWKEGRFVGEHKLFLLTGASRSWEFGYHNETQEYARQVPCSCQQSAARGKMRNGKAKLAESRTFCESTPICGRLPARTVSPIFVVIRR